MIFYLCRFFPSYRLLGFIGESIDLAGGTWNAFCLMKRFSREKLKIIRIFSHIFKFVSEKQQECSDCLFSGRLGETLNGKRDLKKFKFRLMMRKEAKQA